MFTVWFANFAEALAECRGEAKAASLRRTKQELAKRVSSSGATEVVLAAALRKGDVVSVERNDLIPADGEVLEGVAFVNESAITGDPLRC